MIACEMQASKLSQQMYVPHTYVTIAAQIAIKVTIRIPEGPKPSFCYLLPLQ